MNPYNRSFINRICSLFMQTSKACINNGLLFLAILTLGGILSGCSSGKDAVEILSATTPQPTQVLSATYPPSTLLIRPTSTSTKPVQIIKATENNPRGLLETTTPFPPPMRDEVPSMMITAIAPPSGGIESFRSDGMVQIVSPGDGSQVISPISAVVSFDRSNRTPVIIELRGRDGRLLARQIWSLDDRAPSCAFSNLIPFEIGKTSEKGRFLVSQKDDFGRLVSVDSVDLTLLSGSRGVEILPSSPTNGIIIQQPESNAIINGGVVNVSGIACPGVDEPLRVLIVAENRKVVGQRLAEVKPDSNGECVAYKSEIHYSVDETTAVRLLVYQDGNPMSDIAHLSSLLLILEP